MVTVHIPSGSHAPEWEPYFGQSRVMQGYRCSAVRSHAGAWERGRVGSERLPAMRDIVGWVEKNGTHQMLINGGFRFSSPTLQLGISFFGNPLRLTSKSAKPNN